MDTSILLIEDDPDICELVALYLRREGLRVDIAPSAEQGLELFQRSSYDLLLSDITLPRMDGLQLMQTLRARSDIPIIFMTSRKTPQDIVAGLRLGGDDYITKPFEPEVLVARVLAGLRRCRSAGGKTEAGAGIWRDGWLTIHKDRLEVLVNNTPVALAAKELQLLLHLLEHPKQVFSVSQLYERIWSLNGLSDERTVMVHIHNLRKKIEKDPSNPQYIVTIRGFGYKFGAEK
ncbi:DNA-binding response regulator, OmpR family, contains REC and winged-helix (wHTH) domain [Paenibacillus sp. UNCCL117]|uniref:response regulator transcription factor n=1 Tax=unclassified Paenibacillus TaxID=185978 RepID=UPI00087FA8F3|nr:MULTISPECIES: response regulator transcription factor [unclassified Paenibacillus]SDC13950.1 DNA-binding response regulator, OmpR family, contains REC and winged-helix (wHTH) domain [Paenibacillus sp. cl123]SFW17193.1 DNA-binding response regulator, OmpR family, contains REC and winged-helix (wHTH) domain [Paenibacillus sp. UNCCL117]